MVSTKVELLKVWFLLPCILGCWTCMHLLLSKRGDKKVKLTIAILVFLLLIPPMNAYFALIYDGGLQWLRVLSYKLTWCYGPLIVILIKQILVQRIKLNHYALHFTPFILSAAHDVFSLNVINWQTMVSLLFIQAFSYLGCAFYYIKNNKEKLINLTRQHKNSTYYWLVYLLGGLTAILFYDLIVHIFVISGGQFSYIFLATIASFVAIYINIIALFSIYQPEIFFHELAQENAELIVTDNKQPQLRNVELSPEAAQQLDEQLQKLVTTYKPHLDENISLAKLASLLGISTHHLSELLNIHKSTNFYEFLNDLRYQESLNLLENKDADITIADIAYRSGFNNRNSFYKVFKEKTGITPKEYKSKVAL